jgi:hypothetical protein
MQQGGIEETDSPSVLRTLSRNIASQKEKHGLCDRPPVVSAHDRDHVPKQVLSRRHDHNGLFWMKGCAESEKVKK